MNTDSKRYLDFLQDMHKDYISEKTALAYNHWINNHDIYKMIMELFPERATCRLKVWDLFYDEICPFLPKKEDISVLYWKLKHECEHRDYMLIFGGADTHTGEYIYREKGHDANPIVYFIKCLSTGRIKIGKTNYSPLKRMRQIAVGSSGKHELLGVIYGDSEGLYHMHFDKYRIKGEWFEPAPELLEFIKDNVVEYNEKDKKVA